MTSTQHANQSEMPQIRGVLFDFGGVVAHEGFVDALRREALAQHLDPQAVIAAAVEAMYGCGYMVNAAEEEDFWGRFEAFSGLKGDRAVMREAVLSGCTPRQEVLALASALAAEGIVPAILSDHTDWLDELERRHGFFMHFEYVFNSYHTGSTKRQVASFRNALETMGIAPAEALFIDDARRNVALARELGLQAILFEDPAAFALEFQQTMQRCAPASAPAIVPLLRPFFAGRAGE